MIEFINNFHFIRPWCLLFLLVPLFLYFKNYIKNTGTSSWSDICDEHLLNFLLVNEANAKKISITTYIYIGFISASLAAAGPSWKKTEIPTFIIDNPNMFVLSMAQNMHLSDIAPSRLERAKYGISDLAQNITDGQFGLMVYSEEPYAITPISDDVTLIQNIMSQITPDIVPDFGDRLDRAIDLALKRFQAAGYSRGNIILFSSDVGQRFDLALEKAQLAAHLNYNIHIIDTSYEGNEKLKILTEKGNGVYLSIKDASFQKLINRITNDAAQNVKLSQNLRSNYIDYGYYLLFIPMLCLLLFFRKGVLLIFVCFLLFSSHAEASFLLNNNQEGLRFFNNNDYSSALEKFSDPLWRGISFYKQENNEEALKEFSKVKNSEALYNTGVVLTKMCQYKEALEAFNESLKIDPNNEDAKFNQTVLSDLFEKAKENPELLNCDNQQQQQNQNNQNDDKQDENNQDNNDNQSQNNSEEDNQQQNEDQQNSSNENNSDQSQDNQEQKESSQQDNSQQQNSEQNNNQEQEQKSNSQQQDDNKNNENNSSDKNDSEQQPDEKRNTPDKANQDEGEQNKTNNKEGDDDSGSEEQQEEQPVNLVGAKEGTDDEKYDEEAMIMQRRYREIPEDVGGLLREFIKKDYSKGRYRDENI